jgi:DNA-binding beta-propeller fold protein YncE
VLAPVVSVTKEVPQSGVTNNSWDVNSSSENYTRLNSAPATTLDFSFSDNVDSTFTSANSVTVSSQDSNAKGAVLSSDGNKMFVCGDSNDVILEYALSTAYDLSTATYTQQFDVSSQTADPKSIFFKPDGTEFYLGGDDKVVQYSLSTAWDISTASHTATKTISGYGNTHFIAFNTDGTSLFFVGLTSTTYIWKFNLSTAWSISTASYNSGADISSTVANATARGLAINSDGTKFYVATTSNNIKQFSTSTAYNVSTLSFDNKTSQTLNSGVFGIFFPSDFSRLYVTTSTVVYEYTNAITGLTLGSGSFASADVGKTIEANSGVFILTSTAGAITQTTAPTSYAQVASGSWEMYGVVYNAADGDLELSGFIDLTTKFDVSTAAYSQNFSVATQETSPQGVAFNNDGTKMFVVGFAEDKVFEYTLSTGFDVSTASSSQSFSVTSEDTLPSDIAFNSDGTKMFIVGISGNDINEYALTTGFDVSTASFTDSFSVTSQETSPRGLAFNNDGTKMFVVGSTGDDVNEYNLSTGFDVSTASYSQNFSVSSQDTAPTAITFNTDGTKMFIVGGVGDAVYEYALTTGFDVSTASYSQNFSISSQEQTPTGIAFNTDGSKMFITGQDSDAVNEYTVGTNISPSGYHATHTTTSTDSTYWTDINSMTADEAAGDGNVYYAVSTDDRTTWTVIDNTEGERDIVRNNAGTWQYNSNSTYASETWTNGTTNTELATLAEAMSTAQNRMDKTQLDAVTDPNHIALGNDLDLAIVFNMTSGTTVPSSDGVAINYDANVLNKGAVLGTDYDFDAPAQDKVRITALAGNNLKVRIV